MNSVRTLFCPPVAMIGPGAIDSFSDHVTNYPYKKALVVSDSGATKKIAEQVINHLTKAGKESVLFCDIQPNPTDESIHQGVDVYKASKCDFIVAVGGGSPEDAAKAIGILIANGGQIWQYEGANKSKNRSVPLVCVNTTAGTASELTIFYVITDTRTVPHKKMVMADPNCLATFAVNDSNLMSSMPAKLTAETGMDALTHAVEAYVGQGSYHFTDTLALYAIKNIFSYLPRAVKNGNDIEARTAMAWAEYIAGFSFSNSGLGLVHAMAHQIGGMFDLPHGQCNAILLPHVESLNLPHTPNKFKEMALAINLDITGKSDIEAGRIFIDAIKKLSTEVGIPSALDQVISDAELDLLAKNAMADICYGGNPYKASAEEIKIIYKSITK